MLIYNLATSQDVKGFITSWNISVHEWLKNYVYLRMITNRNRDKKDSLKVEKNRNEGENFIATLSSFLVSAVWHGFYPGFYSFFICSFLFDF